MINTVLVTGGAGFIGSKIANRLLQNGKSVIIVDNLSTGKIENIPEGSIFLELDLGQPAEVKKLNKYKFDAIMHLAGQSSGEVSFYDPEYDFNWPIKDPILSERDQIGHFPEK